ncbi:MAG: alpha-2-macroglobulin, partial [Nitrospinota bacterium]
MRWVCITTGIVFFLASLLTATEAPHVALFSPQGTVKGVQQVRVKFSEQMVPLADPRAHLEPFLIDCPVQGKSRWIDGHNWVYDFTKKLPAGLRCTFTLKPDLKTLAGEALSGQQTFVFSTGGPSIRASIPYQGSTHIAEDQVFLLTLDGEPTQESIRAHVFFAVEGIQERVGVRIVTREEREAILQATYGQRRPTAPLLLIQARQRFPAATRVNLIWGRGVESLTGIPTEKDQILAFRTRPAFTATFHCRRENPRADCLPLTPMSLRFSAPVTWTQARTIVLKGPEGKVWKPEESEEEVVYRVVFPGPFPEKTAFRLEIPPDLTDEAGRSLVNAGSFPLTVKTADYPPLAKFAGRFGILERKASPVLPVTLRNLEPELKMRMLRVESAEAETIPGKLLSLPVEKADEIRAWLGKIYRRGWEDRGTSLFADLDRQERLQEFSLPKPHGGKTFEVVGIPLPGPGFYLVELESPRLGAALLGKPQPMFVPTAVLVTNLSLHFKWGRESSLAWVTTLDSGQPVPAARVTVIDCQGTLWWEGETDRKGIARITGLPWRDEVPRCSYHPLEYGLFVTARTTSGDLALVHSSWDDGIEPWRFQLPTPSARDTIIAHTILDRPLFRAGETVHMKHILRQETETGFGLVPEAKRPQAVLIQHTGSGQRYTLPLTWGENGTAETEWQIPRQARLGLYTVRLVREKGKPWTGWQSGRFRVEAFRVPLMKGRIRFPATPLVSPREVTVDLAVSYLAGGGAARLPVRFRYQVRPKPLPSFAGFEGFVFANGAVQEGLHKPGEEAEERKVPGVQSIDLELDAAGTARTRITGLPVVQAPQEILAELEFRDPNGEVQTISSTVPLWPAHLLVGLKPESWALAQQEVKFRVAVVDLRGKPLPQVPVSVDLFRRKTYSHRKRLVGGFYAYEHFTETRRIETVCTGQTDERGLLFCTFASPVTGNVVLQATVQEATG